MTPYRTGGKWGTYVPLSPYDIYDTILKHEVCRDENAFYVCM